MTSLLATQVSDGENSTTPSNGLMETPLPAIDIDRELLLLSKRIDRLEAKPANAESLIRGLKAFRNGEYIEANFYLQHSLKYDPQNPHLHKMNAISYHLRGDAQVTQASMSLQKLAIILLSNSIQATVAFLIIRAC